MGEHKKRKQCSAIERHHGQVHVPAEEAPSSENEGLLMQRREQFIQMLKVAGLEERRRDKKQRKRTRAMVGLSSPPPAASCPRRVTSEVISKKCGDECVGLSVVVFPTTPESLRHLRRSFVLLVRGAGFSTCALVPCCAAGLPCHRSFPTLLQMTVSLPLKKHDASAVNTQDDTHAGVALR